MKTLTKNEYLGSMIYNHIPFFQTKEGIDLGQTFRCLNLALACDSSDCEALWNLGQTYFLQARNYERLMILEKKKVVQVREQFLILNNPSQLDVGPKVPTGLDYQNRAKQEFEQAVKPANPFCSGIIGQVDPCLQKAKKGEVLNSLSLNQQNRKLPEFDAEIVAIEAEYVPLIKDCLQKSEFYKNKAREMGMVFETTKEYYQRQVEKKVEYDLKHNK